MVRFKRRQLLMGTLLAGVTATTLQEWLRQRRLQHSQEVLSDLISQSPDYLSKSLEKALKGDTEALKRIENIQNSLKLTPPTVPYNRAMSKRLIQCCRLGTEQYLYGKFDPKYDGAIVQLPTHSKALQGFIQIAAIKGPEYAEVQEQVQIPQDVALRFPDPLRERLNLAEDEIRAIAGQTFKFKRKIPVYWGFVLSSPQVNIIAFRGTQLSKEWLQNFQARPIPASNGQFRYEGKIHQGFVEIYSELAQATMQSVERLDPKVPCYFTGHSLGASLAVLAGMDAAMRSSDPQKLLRIYTYGCPRIGNPKFAESSSHLTPNQYRVVNLADAFTLVPPMNIGDYVHVGQEWSFLYQRDDLSSNHYISTYRQAVEQEIETNLTRRYPSSTY